MLPLLSRARIIALALSVATLSVWPSAAVAGGAGGGKKKADTTNPQIVVSAPSAGATTNGSLKVTGTASDNVALSKVEVSIDAGTPVLAQGTSSWSSAIDTTRYSNGSHTITARATDTSGNASSTSVAMNVSNSATDTTPPTISITNPTASSTVHGSFPVSGSAGDNVGVAKVEIRVDSGPFQAVSGTTSWSTSVDLSQATGGAHQITAQATDTSGLTSSATISVNVSNTVVSAPAMQSGTIGGYLFQEADRDGVFQAGEQPLTSQHLYLYTASGAYVGNTYSDSTGWYQFTGLADATYRVQFAPASWWAIRDDWVPDTTGSAYPRRDVQLSGSARADIGWRPIVRSTDMNAPITSYVGANGLKVQSYDDVVPAKDIYDRLMTGALVGSEAQFVTIRFDSQPSSSTSTMAIATNGVYANYSATSNLDYTMWLDGDNNLFHEYGHAWAGYYKYIVQQDPSLTAYLKARGVYGDPRLNTSEAWNPEEMIAEDYRELFGSSNAQNFAQMNPDIPPAKDVPGLKDFLTNTFRNPPAP